MSRRATYLLLEHLSLGEKKKTCIEFYVEHVKLPNKQRIREFEAAMQQLYMYNSKLNAIHLQAARVDLIVDQTSDYKLYKCCTKWVFGCEVSHVQQSQENWYKTGLSCLELTIIHKA